VAFLSGIGKFLFAPLALSVTFAMLASYVVALTVVPVYCARFLRHTEGERQYRWFAAFDRGFDRVRGTYGRLLHRILGWRWISICALVLLFAGSLLLYPRLGKEFFPQVDSGQFNIQMRVPSGTRIEKTENYVSEVERLIRGEIPPSDLQMLISNTGILYDWPAAYTPNAGPMDSSLMVQLTPDHRVSSLEYVRKLRQVLREKYPFFEFSFEAGGLIRSAITFGLPAPLDIEVEGNNLTVARNIADEIQQIVASAKGTADVRIKQRIDYPQVDVNIDRTKTALLGLDAVETVKNVVTALNSSVNFNPAFWIDNKNGNHYFVGAQYREQDIHSLETILDIPITGIRQIRTGAAMSRLFRPAPGPVEIASDGRQQANDRPVLLRNIVSLSRSSVSFRHRCVNSTNLAC
jgi:multidrug efflux pump subunit AcrB